MFTERVICDFKVELYNMMKWLSERRTLLERYLSLLGLTQYTMYSR